MVNVRSWRVSVGAQQTTAQLDLPAAPAEVAFVCAHGAGGHMADRALLALAAELCARGVHVVRFNFLYREQGAARPDPMPRLKECIAAVASFAREELKPRLLLLGGRSMGGRAASMLAAQGCACDGLLLLAYPLHPAGKPQQLRDAHLAHIKVPVLCMNGTRDSLCQRDLMDPVVEGLGRAWTQHWLDGADHAFHVLKRSGRTDAQVMREIGDASQAWLARLAPTS